MHRDVTENWVGRDELDELWLLWRCTVFEVSSLHHVEFKEIKNSENQDHACMLPWLPSVP